jgi:hypothetical protein
MKRILLALLVMFACNDSTSPTAPTPTEPVVESPTPTPPPVTNLRHCKLIEVDQARIEGSTLVVEFHPINGYDPDHMRVKVLVDVDTNLQQFVLIKKLEPYIVHRIDLDKRLLRDALCDTTYDAKIWVEGVKDDVVDQCDGGATVKWKCDPVCVDCVDICDPPPEKPCREAEWLGFPTCAWTECEDKCEPTDEPLCKRYCTWNTETCEWDCDYPECGEYYFFSWEECKCEGKAVCHVSNKGRDGDWNLQESQKRMTPGHELHLDPNLFCPPDYLGACYNKYAQNPHPCMGIED